MKHKKKLIAILTGILLAFLIMCARGLFQDMQAADRILIICDGFTIVAFLYLGIGGLLWVSDTGFFDIFAYAIQKGAHALIPGRVNDRLSGYYEYKTQKQEKRKQHDDKNALFAGLLFLAVSIMLTVSWYMLAE